MSSPKKLIIKPIIIAHRNNRQMVLAPKRMTPNLILSNLKVATVPKFKEDIIYESSNCDFLKGESQQVLIVNKVNIATKTCRTIAKCIAKGVSVETTSDDICALIGQNNYDTVLSALGSVFNEETKVRGILALLRKQTKYRTISTQTENEIKKECADISCQTAESHPEILGKQKPRRRIRKQYTPYVVKPVKKCIINIDNVIKKEDFKTEDLKIEDQEQKKNVSELPDIKVFVDEDSNISCGSNMTSLSMLSHPEWLDQRKVQETLESIQRQTCTLGSVVQIYDGTKIMVPVKPEDNFHLATPDILKNVTNEERRKLLIHQAYIDFNMCLEQNEDGYYPLHIAVLHNDVDLVRRQCMALRYKQESVDKMAAGMTALQMSVHHNSMVACTRELLMRGADPLAGGAERRSALHLAAAAAGPAHLAAMLEHCDRHPREVLKNNQDFWKPQLDNMEDKDLATYLYEKIGELFDDQGNTPLMVAASNGRSAAAELLCSRAPSLVDVASPACGATALYRAVAAACMHAKESGNTNNIPEHFLKTAEVLVSHGADPATENHSGSSVNGLLQESTIAKLSMRIVNAMSHKNHGKLTSNMILVKDKEGRIAPEQTRTRKKDKVDGTARKSIEPASKSVENGKKRKQDIGTGVELKGGKSFKTDATVFEDSKSVDVKQDLDGLKSNKVIDMVNKRKQEVTTDLELKRAKFLKTLTKCIENSKNDSNLNWRNDKTATLKIPPNSNEVKHSDSKPRIVIVENVSVKTDFSNVNLPTAAAVPTILTSNKPKDIVLVSSPKFVKIAPKTVMPVPSTSNIGNSKH